MIVWSNTCSDADIDAVDTEYDFIHSWEHLVGEVDVSVSSAFPTPHVGWTTPKHPGQR
jgi:hypothetical protein